MEQPSPSVHRIMLSTTSRFTGEYESPDISVVHAWTDTFGRSRQMSVGLDENAHSRNYFVLSLDVENPPRVEGTLYPLPDYTNLGERFCAAVSILYGKRFDNHGFLISHGMYSGPDLSDRRPTTYYTAGPNSHSPRQDLGIELKLGEAGRITPLFTDPTLDKHFLDIFFAAGRFYLRSLRMFDVEPEFAYLDLVTCGEILANYYKYPEAELYDEDVCTLLGRIRTEMDEGDEVTKRIKGSMRQIKRAYTFTLTRLLTDSFFDNTEATESYGRLRKDDIQERVKAAYDLRSLYVHTGVDFGRWVHPLGHTLNEVQIPGLIVGGGERFGRAVRSPRRSSDWSGSCGTACSASSICTGSRSTTGSTDRHHRQGSHRKKWEPISTRLPARSAPPPMAPWRQPGCCQS